MEQNLPIIAKRCWKTIRIIYLMLRNSISKRKLLTDLSLLMKRSTLAGKAFLHSLIFHYRLATTPRMNRTDSGLDYEYEFSCSDSPVYYYPVFHLIKRKNSSPAPIDMAAALELFHSATASPALPGFGPSPAVRQLRISDSPFHLKNSKEGEEDGDSHVDEAAEEFIMKFYRDLERQAKNSPSVNGDS